MRDPAAWVAALGNGRAQPPTGSGGAPVAGVGLAASAEESGAGLHLVSSPGHWSPQCGSAGGCRVIFDGTLDDRPPLLQGLALDPRGVQNDAELVAQAYLSWGESVFPRLRGSFACIVRDDARHLSFCLRDPLGMHPLFYAETGRALLFSPSIDSLLAQPGVSRELNRARLVDRLMRRWPVNDETYHACVQRVPPGHVMRLGDGERSTHRIWDPIPADRPFAWLPEDEVQERFNALFEQAVGRTLPAGPAGILLSGGLDSSAIAAVATDLCRRDGRALPRTLSLTFSGLAWDDAALQARIAAALGLKTVQVPFDEAAGGSGTLAAALDMTRSLPAPLWVIWRPALIRLAQLGRENSCEQILAGDGADEWLWENDVLALDHLKSLDLVGLLRLWHTYAHSYHFSRAEALRVLLWRPGVRRLAHDAWRSAAEWLGAEERILRQRRSAAVKEAGAPSWIAPDPALRTQIAERLERSHARDDAATGGSYYLRDTRARMDHAEKWFMQEETFLLARRVGVPMHQPFWDPDLIE
ncbi:MAG: asparagine synthase-related protein, partial [Burkholderiales bacterium]